MQLLKDRLVRLPADKKNTFISVERFIVITHDIVIPYLKLMFFLLSDGLGIT